jgi:hypothetical protein
MFLSCTLLIAANTVSIINYYYYYSAVVQCYVHCVVFMLQA